MGIAERWLRARFSAELCDHHTFVFCGDGDLEEGVKPPKPRRSPGTLASADWPTSTTTTTSRSTGRPSSPTTTNVPERFRAYGWDVDEIGDVANDCDVLEPPCSAPSRSTTSRR